MTASFVRDHVETNTKTAGTTNLSAQIGLASNDVGNLLVARIVFDNTTATAPLVSSIAKMSGETNDWVRVASFNSSSASSAGGVRGEMWAIVTTLAWDVSSTYTITLSASVAAKACQVREYAGATVTVRGTAGTSTSTTGVPSATTSGTAPAVGDLLLGLAGWETRTVATQDSTNTLGGAWSTGSDFGTTGGSATTNVEGLGSWKVPDTAGHQTYAPTCTNTDSGACVVALVPALVTHSATAALTATATIGASASITGGTPPPPALVQQATASTDAGTTLALAVPITATTAGNCLVMTVGLRTDTSRSVGSVTDTAGNTWSLAASANPGTGSGSRTETWYTLNAASVTSATVNIVGGAAIKAAASLAEFSGVATVSALDSTAGVSGATVTALPSGSVTPTAADTLIVAAINATTAGGTRSFVSGSPWVELTRYSTSGGSDVFGSTAYRALGVASAQQAEWSQTSTVNYSGTTVALLGTPTGSTTKTAAASLAVTATIEAAAVGAIRPYTYPITRSGTTQNLAYFSNGDLAVTDLTVTRLLVAVHGVGRTAEAYAGYALQSSRDYGVGATTRVVAPHFIADSDIDNSDPTRIYWGTSGWSEGNTSNSTPYARAWTLSSFAVLDEMVRTAAASFPNLTEIVVAGHSAGGQFTNRYAAGTGVPGEFPALLFRFVPGNPSSWLYMDALRYKAGSFSALTGAEQTACAGWNDYKYGLVGLNGYMSAVGAATIPSRYASRRVVMLLGDADNDPAATDLDLTCPGSWQGTDRYDRGLKYEQHLTAHYGTLPALHSTAVAPGVAHSANNLWNSSVGKTALFSSTQSAAATLTATATLSGTSAGTRSADATRATTATLTATAAGAKPADASLSASALISGSATVIAAPKSAAASLSVAATTTAAAASVKSASASLTVTTSPSATAARTLGATSSLTVTAAPTATSAGTKSAAASLPVTATFTAAAVVGAAPKNADAAMTATVTTTATASVTKSADASLTVTAAPSGTSAGTKSATSSLATTATVTAAAEKLGSQAASTSLTATTVVTAAATVTKSASASLAVTATPSGTTAGVRGTSASLTVTAAPSATATGVRDATTVLTVTATRSATADKLGSQSATASLTATAATTATASVVKSTTAALTATASTSTTATTTAAPVHSAQAALSVTAATSATATRVRNATASLTVARTTSTGVTSAQLAQAQLTAFAATDATASITPFVIPGSIREVTLPAASITEATLSAASITEVDVPRASIREVSV